MPHPHHHSLSSVKRWGGVPDDYAAIHDLFDLIWTGKPFRTIPRRRWSSRWVHGAALAVEAPKVDRERPKHCQILIFATITPIRSDNC